MSRSVVSTCRVQVPNGIPNYRDQLLLHHCIQTLFYLLILTIYPTPHEYTVLFLVSHSDFSRISFRDTSSSAFIMKITPFSWFTTTHEVRSPYIPHYPLPPWSSISNGSTLSASVSSSRRQAYLGRRIQSPFLCSLPPL